MAQVVFSEFRDSTSNINYPFIDTASRTDKDNQIIIPKDLIIDASIYLPGADSMLYISTIEISKNEAVITIKSKSGNYSCSGKITDLGSEYSYDYNLALHNELYKVGVLLINSLKISWFTGLQVGTYEFRYDSTAFIPSCITLVPEIGISSIYINEKNEDNVVFGDVWLIGNKGIFLRTKEDVPNSIRIDVIGDPLFKQAAYPDRAYEIANPLQTINGIKPDEYGNFNITRLDGDDGLRLNTSPDGLNIHIAGASYGN